MYTEASIFSLFWVLAFVFGAMSLYGCTTNTDLSGVGNLLMTFVVGLIAALIINLYKEA
ncbi:TPA: hypothetical protein HA338_14210 [Methanosarcina acetivorans]|uniref:Uncharacterized protein n=1 Tax=Methanosarcina acetivorans TaxID=2214 RepID=A0A832SDV7_9EURY|nr:Bax inhibitor-1 family protein [Methanosarcina acetivorans]HIH95114.1 hypothetical protein [Methanosarcina acetivorans]